MGMFFKNVTKITDEIEVNGQTFLLTRPSAKDRIDFMAEYDKAIKNVSDEDINRVMFDMNCLLVAYFSCELPEFEGKTKHEIAQIIADEVEEYSHINDIANRCWDILGLKTEGSSQETESSPVG